MVRRNSIGRDKNFWDAEEAHHLLEHLYTRDITIEEFKKLFTEAGMDYNQVEHCCCCAGCHWSDTHKCPDYEEDDLECKILDPVFCMVCGEKASIGYPMTDNDNTDCFTFWICEKHMDNKGIENALKKGIAIDKLYGFTKRENR